MNGELGNSHGLALAVRGVSKTFDGQRALRDLSLTVRAGEIHGVVGENGSGKSTLIKLLAGFHAPDSATGIVVCGQQVELPLRPGQARSLGVSFVHQELGLIKDLSVLENLVIEDFASRNIWGISWPEQRRRAASMLAEFGLSFDPGRLVSDLRPTEQALLAVARAAARIRALASGNGKSASGLLVLDEPTVYLPAMDRQRLFDLMRSVASTGVAILFVSHDIDEVLMTSDRVTVLRDGRAVGTVESSKTSPDELISMILGSEQVARDNAVRRVASRAHEFRIADLSGRTVRRLSLEIRGGGIIGLTGLPGSGFDDIPYMLFGAELSDSGTIELQGKRHELCSMVPSLAVNLGVALIPADRPRAGAVGSLTVADNISLQVLREYLWGPMLSRFAMLRGAKAVVEDYDVRPRDPRLLYASLSGGNQQKVLLAKWMQTKPQLLLLHEPTQGVDIGARMEIYDLLRRAAGEGCVVVVASTDHEQLAALCDRVLITRSGAVVHDLDGAAITKNTITELCYASAESVTAAASAH
jgi:ribose transport system ATP-binding protein